MSAVSQTTYPARIHLILATERNKAVIIRRGPSRWTQLIVWDLDNNQFQQGQWFHGRIYEERCDLSPSGDYLVYFAAKFNRHQSNRPATNTWTAVSNPPFYTALVLWPKGDCWGGGGLFRSNHELELHEIYSFGSPILHPSVPDLFKHLQVTTFPCLERRITKLERHGWKLINEENSISPIILFGTGSTYNLEKTYADKVIHLKIDRFGQLKYELSIGKKRMSMGDAEQMELSRNGRIVLIKQGKIFQFNEKKYHDGFGNFFDLVIDLNANKPEKIIGSVKMAPQEGKKFKRRWPRQS